MHVLNAVQTFFITSRCKAAFLSAEQMKFTVTKSKSVSARVGYKSLMVPVVDVLLLTDTSKYRKNVSGCVELIKFIHRKSVNVIRIISELMMFVEPAYLDSSITLLR